MTPAPTPTDGLQRAPLDVYKKIAVVRSADDSVTYEDSQGRIQRISGLGNEAISAVRIIEYIILYYCVFANFSRLI